MTIRKTLILTALFLSQIAIAQRPMETLINAVETAPSNINLPASESGTLFFKPCADVCDKDFERLTLAPTTLYRVNGSAVKFEDFRKSFALVGRDGYALVSYDTKTKMVTSIEISG